MSGDEDVVDANEIYPRGRSLYIFFPEHHARQDDAIQLTQPREQTAK